MMPAVLRQSGRKYLREGVMFTPRAMIAQCEICGMEHAPYGFADASGKRTYFCTEHNPDRKAKGEGDE